MEGSSSTPSDPDPPVTASSSVNPPLPEGSTSSSSSSSSSTKQPPSTERRREHVQIVWMLEEEDYEEEEFNPHEQPVKRSSSLDWLPPTMSELRVVLLGNSWSERSSVGNVILGETKFNTEEEPDCFLRERVQLKGKEVVLINTPDLLHPQTIRQSRQAELISDPGPHVFLLVLQPEDFTEEHKLKLCRFLQLFNDRSFHHCLVLISTPRKERPGFMEKYLEHPPLKDMIKECQYRFFWRKNLELREVLIRLGQIVKENNGEHLRSDQPIEDLLHMLSI